MFASLPRESFSVVVWQETLLLKISSKDFGKRPSSAAVLDHEFDHAEDYFEDPEKHMLNVLKPTGNKYHNAEEMKGYLGQ